MGFLKEISLHHDFYFNNNTVVWLKIGNLFKIPNVEIIMNYIVQLSV